MALKYKFDGKPCFVKKAARMIDTKFGPGTLAAIALEGLKKASRDPFYISNTINLDGHRLEIIFR